MKTKAKKAPKVKKGFTKCPDCKAVYKTGGAHYMFCNAKTCDACGTTYPAVIEKVHGKRTCERCLQGPEEE
jgi:hypothetical protein